MRGSLLLLIILTISTIRVAAQRPDLCNYEVRGVVLDADNQEALPFVRVAVKGTQQFSLADENGEFHIEGLCDQADTLVSYLPGLL